MWSSHVGRPIGWQFYQDDHFQREAKYGKRLSIDRGFGDITRYSGAWVNNVISAVRRMGTTLMSLYSIRPNKRIFVFSVSRAIKIRFARSVDIILLIKAIFFYYFFIAFQVDRL